MAVNKVEICGLDTSKLPMMTYERSTELLKKISEGDEEARDIFIKENLRLVLSVIQRFSGRGEQMDDLFQVGCIGLIKAINNFDLSFNVRFSTYAVPMIIGEVRRHLRDNNSLRVSRSIRDTAYHALQIRARLMDESGQEPQQRQWMLKKKMWPLRWTPFKTLYRFLNPYTTTTAMPYTSWISSRTTGPLMMTGSPT